jgi:hypothetical protein
MFPFKVQLFQGCKSETEPISIKSVVKHVIRYQVLLAAYYKADTKYCWRHIIKPIPSIVGNILQSILNLIYCVKVLRGVKMAEPCERTLRNCKRNVNESLVEKSDRLRDRNETFKIC